MSRARHWLGGDLVVVPRAARRELYGEELRARLAELDADALHALVPWCPDADSDGGLLEAVARAVEAGELELFERGASSFGVGMSPVIGGDANLDWDDVPRLSDLRLDDPTVALVWLSIQLLDARGIAFAGQDVTVVYSDGARERVVLDAAGSWIGRRVPKTAQAERARVVLPARLELSETQRQGTPIEGFRRHPDDIAVARRNPADVELPRLERNYRLIVRPSPRFLST